MMFLLRKEYGASVLAKYGGSRRIRLACMPTKLGMLAGGSSPSNA